MFEICSGLSKIVLKIYYFCQHSKKAKWQNHFISRQTVSKRPNGNPGSACVHALPDLETITLLSIH